MVKKFLFVLSFLKLKIVHIEYFINYRFFIVLCSLLLQYSIESQATVVIGIKYYIIAYFQFQEQSTIFKRNNKPYIISLDHPFLTSYPPLSITFLFIVVEPIVISSHFLSGYEISNLPNSLGNLRLSQATRFLTHSSISTLVKRFQIKKEMRFTYESSKTASLIKNINKMNPFLSQSQSGQ